MTNKDFIYWLSSISTSGETTSPKDRVELINRLKKKCIDTLLKLQSAEIKLAQKTKDYDELKANYDALWELNADLTEELQSKEQ